MSQAIPHDDTEAAKLLEQAPSPLALLRRTAARRPDHPALIYLRDASDPQPVTLTYGQLLEEVETLCRALKARGVSQGDGIPILLPLVPQAVSSLIAALTVGVAFPVNLLLSPEALAAQFKLARAREVIVMGPHPALDVRERVGAAIELLAREINLVEVALGEPTSDSFSWARLLAAGNTDSPVEDFPEAPAALVHTGGTTGAPKLAELTQRNLAAGAIMAASALGWRENDRILTGLPLFHVGGSVDMLLSGIAAGATLMFPTALGLRNPEVISRFWPLVDETRATLVGGVPTMLSAMVSSPRAGSTLSTLRGFVTGGSPLPAELKRKVEEVSGKPVCQLYGQTETAGITTAQSADGSYHPIRGGRPIPMMKVAIGGPNGSFQPGDTGEVFVSGPNVFLGYRTNDGIQGGPADGWISTGDLGEVTEDGDLRLVGRSKEIIIRSGHNIDPLLIEEVAMAHPAVAQAAAVAMPDAYAGELPVLYVALTPGAQVSPEELIAHTGERIAEPPARPKHTFILEEMPLTPVGKIARYKLKQMATEHQVGRALSSIDTLEKVTCQDNGARQVGLYWKQKPTSEQRKLAATVLADLGLEQV
ncbi:AMP-binding protein [Alloalcanivorax xenomutans]|uniref:AMP-binding protein n=1 Tax=Alloalcanivorax xenomutans TaxID=1094342 RepID=UPI0007A73C90|nr:AMP-binding protein [Alloalcanivorax xenomutans]KYZ86329.1 acyl-CoA synthetase [Alcanivorax sp. KX64203]WOA30159.1 AMP-binding protein [Alloalcanivorax xenomutans]